MSEFEEQPSDLELAIIEMRRMPLGPKRHALALLVVRCTALGMVELATLNGARAALYFASASHWVMAATAACALVKRFPWMAEVHA